MSTSSHPELRKLRQRLLDKEISEETYQELKKEILEEIDGQTGQPLPVRSDSIDFGAEPLYPGEKIGPVVEEIGEPRYLIEDEIGRGGWGVVYRADDRKLRRPVALKAIFAAATQNKKAFKRISYEARLGMTLNHPNIVRIIDFDHYQGKYFLVMELAGGGDLTGLLAERVGEKLELAETVKLLKGVCEGLDYMHSMGIVHRDLKPENLLWHPEQKQLKITDFGFAYTARQSVLLSGMTVSKLSGTEPYMAPEIWQAEEPSLAGDLYALGILTYEMLKGYPPFPGPNFEHQHCTVPPRPIADLPGPVNDALQKILAKNPAERHESALIFYHELTKPPFPECPVCGRAEDVERFQCAECGKTDICQSHCQRGKYCPDCIQKIIAEEEAKAEKERLERERAEAARQQQLDEERRELEKARQEQARVEADRQQRLEEERKGAEEPAKEKAASSKPPAPKKSGNYLWLMMITAVILLIILQPWKAGKKPAPQKPQQAEEKIEHTEPAPGSIIDGPLRGMQFAYIPAGSFMMGSPEEEEGRDSDEGPRHRVTLQPFYMMTTEVTQAMWREVMGNNPSSFKGDNLPVECVSWNDCQEFIKKLNQRYPGKGYRLPSEAEWEYACRAGTITPFNTGATISTDQANYDGNYTYGNGVKGIYRKKTTPVKSFRSNSWNLYDMHGNVGEWCEDSYHGSDADAPRDGSAWNYPNGQSRLLRGGSWRLLPYDCRSAGRVRLPPDDRRYYIGFRIVF